jgi:hypothetical protein
MGKLDVDEQVEQVRSEGFCILYDCLPVELIDACNEAFQSILEEHAAEIAEKPNRGAMRMYLSLPLRPPFYDKRIFDNDAILSVVERLLGENMVISQYATDTPLAGSEHQDVHQDLGVLFPEEPDLVHPPEVIAVNFPFVDVTAERGPFEVARGTHNIPYSKAFQGIEAGEIPLEPVFLNRGDVLIRNPRCLHRGTPNTTGTPRPVAVIGCNRWWLERSNRAKPSPMSRDVLEHLSEREQRLLRLFECDDPSTG